ncbi:hypothetical protein Taro_033130 [Colocasia esculenta]|uniref:C2H2-type domain-containing protein n=1 Tax=Colocasia esculenta TaxID=4460 RepID=A0A843WBK7_COLES|nr:hypothetical protein [Colocasia esculenta]
MSNPDDKGLFTGQGDPEQPPSPVPRVAGGDGGGSGAVTPSGGTQTQRGKNRSLRDITSGEEQDEPAGSSTKPRTRRKPDPSAANVTEPCSECGRRFWSQKALFGHMRCHPERQWRGVNPPPHLRRPQPTVDNQPPVPPPPSSPLPPPPQGGQGAFQDAEREVATCLVMLANGPTPEDDASGPTEEAGATDATQPAALPPSQVDVFPPSGTTDATPPVVLPPSQVHLNFPPSGATDATTPVAPPPSQAHVSSPLSGATDAVPQQVPIPFQAHANCRFECSSCKKVFGSHQALGGHRASHKNVKGCFAMAKNEGEEASGVSGGGNNDPGDAGDDGRRAGEGTVSAMGTEEHRCKVCNKAFSSGQALGGHQRGHCTGRDEPEAFSSVPRSNDVPDLNLPPPPENSGSSPDDDPALDLKLGMTRPSWALWPCPQGRGRHPGHEMVAPGEPVATLFCGDTPGRHNTIETRVGVVFLSQRLEASRLFDHLFGVMPGMAVATASGVATWLLSRRADPSRLGGRRFKTEAAPHSPPLALSLPLLPSSPPLELSYVSLPVLRARGARAEVVPSHSCRGRVRGAWNEEEVVILT